MKCNKPSKGQFTKNALKMMQKMRITERRKRQLARTPDVDARVTYWSKNTDPRYRKEGMGG